MSLSVFVLKNLTMRRYAQARPIRVLVASVLSSDLYMITQHEFCFFACV